jgi:hypothetical protein
VAAYLGCNVSVLHDRLQVRLHLVVDADLVLDQHHHASILEMVRHNLAQLGKVPAVPLTHAHDECVDGLVQRIKQGDSLHTHVSPDEEREMLCPAVVEGMLPVLCELCQRCECLPQLHVCVCALVCLTSSSDQQCIATSTCPRPAEKPSLAAAQVRTSMSRQMCGAVGQHAADVVPE